MQVSSPSREPSFAAQKFMTDMFATPGSRACSSGGGSGGGGGCGAPPVLYRNAVPALRPWEQQSHRGNSHAPPANGQSEGNGSRWDK